MSGIVFGEQPRWHEGRLWFSDWGPGELIAVDLDGHSEVMLHVGSFPCCADWLPDGRLLVVSTADGLLLRQEPDGSLVPHASLATVSSPAAGNELVVDGRGNAYVNGGGFNLAAGEPFAPGIIAVAAPEPGILLLLGAGPSGLTAVVRARRPCSRESPRFQAGLGGHQTEGVNWGNCP